ncbi:MAG: sigma-70 family RNA polymerase sigma factor [Oscillospiraceae bacterium]|nr:sigma-70 family RNA polymerase sigma factor [Oscillospiraceae bacterium]
MEDSELIALFEQRDESAVSETTRQYGALCRSMAAELTGSPQDAEEICNDVMLAVWNAIPPEKPANFLAYLAGITRNLAMKRLRTRYAKHRGSGDRPAVLDELAACIPSGDDVEHELNRRLLTAAVDRFLSALPAQTRAVFVLRYTYGMPVEEIARRRSLGVSAVKVSLHRTRKKLQTFLKEEGFL